MVGVLVAANLAIACACLWRKRHDAARQDQELLAEAKARCQEREGETELSANEYVSLPPSAAPPPHYEAEHTPRALAEHTKERVREERQSEAMRKHASSYVIKAREEV